jgi:hypothetical protein
MGERPGCPWLETSLFQCFARSAGQTAGGLGAGIAELCRCLPGLELLTKDLIRSFHL